ncbi:MAG: hypothetical protein ACKO6R_08765, partial [Burkholderiaceae bacterium]
GRPHPNPEGPRNLLAAGNQRVVVAPATAQPAARESVALASQPVMAQLAVEATVRVKACSRMPSATQPATSCLVSDSLFETASNVWCQTK